MSNELILRQLQQLLAQQQGGSPPAPQQSSPPAMFGGAGGNAIFGQQPKEMYAGPITDQKETMKEIHHPDGTVERVIEKYQWFGGPEWHAWKRKG
jgi:hypothetical protein